MKTLSGLVLATACVACSSGKSANVGPSDAGPPVPEEFRYGINGGFPNSAWSDQDLAQLEVAAGATSQRISLPETHLTTWGWTIEVADVTAYAAMGMSPPVAFLTGPTREHSTAPSSAADWEVAYYMPKNLHEPITDASGAINPNNYWANYVYQTVKTYSPWVTIWEIWNEPDWVSDWQVTQAWATRAPTKADLPRFNGSIYDYVRMLRVSREAARLADPRARIATGGLGYANFLAAIYRYTDEPTSGKVDAQHPKTGKDYVDVVSFHYYPIYTAGNSEAGVNGFLAERSDLNDVVTSNGSPPLGWECTETGAPRVAVGTYPGGAVYARNYLLKVMTLAQTVGLGGVHWFVLSDGASDGDPYHAMGLYQPVANLTTTASAVRTDTGVAYATLTKFLRGAGYDAAATAALGLPSTVRGAALQKDTRILILWAIPPSNSEDAAATLSVASTTGFQAYAWDHAATSASTPLASVNGVASLPLTGSPALFVER